jgi:hypothetical protein
MVRTRSLTLGPASRPVAVPDDVEETRLTKASGQVELPFHIRWSGPPLTYDLTDRADRARVYEQVLREGAVARSSSGATFIEVPEISTSSVSRLRVSADLLPPSNGH